MRGWGRRGRSAPSQPSVRTDDSAAEVRLGYLPTHFREQLERRKAQPATSLTKVTTKRDTKAGQALRPPRGFLEELVI
jgi:hypothetical protein